MKLSWKKGQSKLLINKKCAKSLLTHLFKTVLDTVMELSMSIFNFIILYTNYYCLLPERRRQVYFGLRNLAITYCIVVAHDHIFFTKFSEFHLSCLIRVGVIFNNNLWKLISAFFWEYICIAYSKPCFCIDNKYVTTVDWLNLCFNSLYMYAWSIL